MSGDPPVCNALHAPIAGDIDCADWDISSVASSAIAASQAWFNSGGTDWIRSIAIRQSQVNQSFGYEIQESIEARRAAIARDTRRQADEAIARNTHPAIALSELQAICDRHLNPSCEMLDLEFTAVYSRYGKKDSENFETLSDAFAYLENGSDEGWIYAIGIFNSRSKLYWLPDSEMFEEINSKALIEFAATKFEQHDLKNAVSCEN